MDPELVQYFGLMYDYKYHRVKAHHENGYKKYQLQVLHPGQTKRGREIIAFGTVVYHMGSPPETLHM